MEVIYQKTMEYISFLFLQEEEFCNFLVFSRFLSECEMDLAFQAWNGLYFWYGSLSF